jgi:hypothetical protein
MELGGRMVGVYDSVVEGDRSIGKDTGREIQKRYTVQTIQVSQTHKIHFNLPTPKYLLSPSISTPLHPGQISLHPRTYGLTTKA